MESRITAWTPLGTSRPPGNELALHNNQGSGCTRVMDQCRNFALLHLARAGTENEEESIAFDFPEPLGPATEEILFARELKVGQQAGLMASE